MIVQIKTEEEIQGFKQVGEITGAIMAQLIDFIRVGISTNDINEKAIELCESYKVSPAFLGYDGFPAAICASVNNALVHGIPTDEPIESTDLVSIDLGVERNGYIGDTAVTVLPEESSDSFSHEKDILVACERALFCGIDAARVGNKLSDIARAIRLSHNYSYPECYGGHGIDRYKLHSAPFVANDPELLDEDITLRPGMIVAIEPMLILGNSGNTAVAKDGWTVMADDLCAHFEHTVLVTDLDPIILTRR